MTKPIIYKKDTKYNVSYINKNGETKNIEYTPEEDLSIAKIITNIKDENSDYLKLVNITESKSVKKESLLKEDNKMEYKTYADIVNDGRAADVADNVYDMLVYMDYDPDSDDYFDMFMKEFCKQLNIVDASQLESGIVVCNVTEAVKNHYKVFDDIFELNGEDEEENIGDIVSEMIPDIVSGYTTDKVYEQLYYGFIDAPIPYTEQPEVKPENIEDHSVSEEDKKEESKLQEDFDPTLDLRVKPRFEERFPEEGSFIDQIPEDLTFRKVLDGLNNEENIYDVIGVDDSVVREEIFILLSDLLDVEYDEIYQLWLHGPKKDKANENFTMKKEDINEEDTFEELIPEELEDEVNEEETAEPEEVESDTELEGSGEDQTQTQLDVEEAVEEVENPTEEDKLATEVANSSLDVLIADEESAIEGYNGFLTQAKNTLLPPLYEVLEKEINEIIRDEEDHINKLNTIKSAFHIEDMPLDESKEIKTEVFEEGASIFELKFDCSNEDTFGTGYDLSDTIGKVLENITKNVQEGRLDGPIMDINGNKIGSFGLGYEGVMSPLDESKEIKTESVEDKNLANIKSCLNQSGIRNPHTVERMAKDVLAILNTYDEDTKDDEGIFYQPVILNAIQDKVEKITGKRPELTIESKEIKTESVEANIFENINTLQDLQEVIENLYEQEKINDDIYIEISDYISTRIDEVEKYIEERSKVTNTDERDIVGIMEDNTLDAIETVKKILNDDTITIENTKKLNKSETELLDDMIRNTKAFGDVKEINRLFPSDPSRISVYNGEWKSYKIVKDSDENFVAIELDKNGNETDTKIGLEKLNESTDNELQNLRDEIWEYIIDDYHRLEDFTDLEVTEETNEEAYNIAKENLTKFNIEDLKAILKEIKSGNIDLSDWGHKALSNNLNESKKVTLDDVLNELGIMKDSPAEQEESSKIKEFMEAYPEASLDQIVNAYKNYEETGLFECKEIKTEDHQLYYDDIQEMSTEERHKLWMSEHEEDFEDTDEGNSKFWDWAEEEFPMKELNESNK